MHAVQACTGVQVRMVRRQAPLLEDAPTLQGFLVVEPFKSLVLVCLPPGSPTLRQCQCRHTPPVPPTATQTPQAQAPSKHPQARGDILRITPTKTFLADLSTVHPCAHTYMCHAASRAACPGTAMQPANDIRRSATTTEISEA